MQEGEAGGCSGSHQTHPPARRGNRGPGKDKQLSRVKERTWQSQNLSPRPHTGWRRARHLGQRRSPSPKPSAGRDVATAMVPSEKRGTARMGRGVAGHGPCDRPFSQQTFPTRLLCAKPGSRPRSQQWTRRNKTPYSSETCFLGAGRGSIEEPHVRGLRRQEKALNRSLLREPLRTEIAYLNRSQLCRNGRGRRPDRQVSGASWAAHGGGRSGPAFPSSASSLA